MGDRRTGTYDDQGLRVTLTAVTTNPNRPSSNARRSEAKRLARRIPSVPPRKQKWLLNRLAQLTQIGGTPKNGQPVDIDPVVFDLLLGVLLGNQRQILTPMLWRKANDLERFHDDLVQETMVRLRKGLTKWEGDRQIYAWIERSIAWEAQTKRDQLKRRWETLRSSPPQDREWQSGFSSRLVTRHEVREALLELPPRYRPVMWYVEGEGMTVAQAAERLETSTGAIRGILRFARPMFEEAIRRLRRER